MQNTQTPPRPKITKDMITEAATKIIQQIGNHEDASDIAIEYLHGEDAYDLAKKLDEYHGWDIDAGVVEALDGLFGEVSLLHNAACKDWFAKNNIHPPLEVGTEIKQGVITGICQYTPACYLVKETGCTNAKRSLLIKFEDAVAKSAHDISEGH